LSNAGGVGLYIEMIIQYSINHEMSVDSPDSESLFIKVVGKTNLNKN